MGTPAPSGPEVLGNGREPEPDRPSDDTPPAARKLRAPRGLWAIGLAVALLLGGVWYAGRPDLDGSPSLPKTSGTGNHQQSAAPDATTLVSGLAEGHDLAAPSSPALDSFIASGGHVLLFMQVKNIGAEPLRILDGVVPQDGTSRDLNAGGLSAGTSGGGVLQPGDQTEIFLRLTVRCPEVLDGPAAKAVLLVAEQPGRHPRLERVRTDALGSYWDEARQAACRPSQTGDVSARVVPQSVRAVRADDGSLTVSAVLAIHNSAGFAAIITGSAVSAGGGGRLVVDGGSTRSVPMRWVAGRCGRVTAPVNPASAPTYRVELPQVAANGQVRLDDSFAVEWTSRISAACVRTSG